MLGRHEGKGSRKNKGLEVQGWGGFQDLRANMRHQEGGRRWTDAGVQGPAPAGLHLPCQTRLNPERSGSY